MNAEIANALPEMTDLERLIKEYPSLLSVKSLCHVDAHGHRFPVYLLTLGDNAPATPAIGFFGGVHGLERIGTQVLLASAADQLVPPHCTERISRQWQTGFAVHPVAGHDLPLDDGVWVAAQVRDWLHRTSPTRMFVRPDAARSACR